MNTPIFLTSCNFFLNKHDSGLGPHLRLESPYSPVDMVLWCICVVSLCTSLFMSVGHLMYFFFFKGEKITKGKESIQRKETAGTKN